MMSFEARHSLHLSIFILIIQTHCPNAVFYSADSSLSKVANQYPSNVVSNLDLQTQDGVCGVFEQVASAEINAMIHSVTNRD